MRRFLRLLSYYIIQRPDKALNMVKASVKGGIGLISYKDKETAPDPTNFILRITRACNLRCVQCGQWGDKGAYKDIGQSDSRQELAADDWLRFIRENAKNIPHVFIWGGEPLLKKGITDIIRCCSDHGITTEMNTNGILLQDMAQELVGAGIDYLAVSIDGPQEVNNAIRLGADDAYGKAAAGMAAVLAERKRKNVPVPLVELCMTLTPHNQSHIKETYEIARDMGADVFHLQFGIFTTAGLEMASSRSYKDAFGSEPRYWKGFVRDVSAMDPGTVKRQIEEIRKDARARRKTVYRQTPFFDFKAEDYFFRPAQFLSGDRCSVPWRYMQIMPNGDVSLCMDFLDLITGNIRQEKWRDIWNGARFRQYRRYLLRNGIFPASSRCCSLLQHESKIKLLLKNLF